jgi:hypothetical protein
MKLKIGFVILLILFLVAWFALKDRSQSEIYQVRMGDLYLCFSAQYAFDTQTEKIFSETKGTLYPLVGDGEKVKAQEEICLVQGDNTKIYKSSQAGLVVFRTRGEVESGALLLEILPLEGSIRISMYPEQARDVSGKEFLGLQFPFSGQEVWGEFLSMERRGDLWDVRLMIRDFLPQLLKAPSGVVTIFYGSLKQVPLIPKRALTVQNGELGVYRETNGDFEFSPVQILGSDYSNLAVSGIKPGSMIKIGP